MFPRVRGGDSASDGSRYAGSFLILSKHVSVQCFRCTEVEHSSEAPHLVLGCHRFLIAVLKWSLGIVAVDLEF
jgi:hypothetical protein